MKINGSMVLGLAMVLLLSGCLSTPARRVQREPQLFSTFPPDVQAKVQAGEVGIGFSRDMVRLALGRPGRIHARTTEAGEIEIWLYMHSRYISRYEPSTSGYWYRDRAGRMHHTYDSLWVNRGGWYEDYPTLRLEFAGDKLKVIERLK